MQNAIATIKETNPIVLTVANNVTPADVANGLNALGASPMMSQTPEEADDMVNIAQADRLGPGRLRRHHVPAPGGHRTAPPVPLHRHPR